MPDSRIQFKDGETVVIHPKYRRYLPTAEVEHVWGNGFVDTNRGTFHETDIAPVDEAPEEWLNAVVKLCLWG